MEMLSGGYYKATIHRVFQPPVDQRGHTRLGLFYFGYTDDNVRLVPFAESPVLQRVGIERKCEDADAPTMKEWRVLRSSRLPGEGRRMWLGGRRGRLRMGGRRMGLMGASIWGRLRRSRVCGGSREVEVFLV